MLFMNVNMYTNSCQQGKEWLNINICCYYPCWNLYTFIVKVGNNNHIVMLSNIISCVNSLGISTQRRNWKNTLGLEQFKGIKGKKKDKYEIFLMEKWAHILSMYTL